MRYQWGGGLGTAAGPDACMQPSNLWALLVSRERLPCKQSMTGRVVQTPAAMRGGPGSTDLPEAR